MNAEKLINEPVLYEIGGEQFRVGKLTIGTALKLESWLAKLPTPWEVLSNTDILKHCSEEQRKQIIDEKLQQLHFWPPDAISAISDERFLRRADFGSVFVEAILKAYNSHLSQQEIDRAVQKATIFDVYAIQLISTSTGSTEKKVPEANQVNTETESTGAVSWPA